MEWYQCKNTDGRCHNMIKTVSQISNFASIIINDQKSIMGLYVRYLRRM